VPQPLAHIESVDLYLWIPVLSLCFALGSSQTPSGSAAACGVGTPLLLRDIWNKYSFLFACLRVILYSLATRLGMNWLSIWGIRRSDIPVILESGGALGTDTGDIPTKPGKYATFL